jgi:MarR family transcriptional repressor of emrRAB
VPTRLLTRKQSTAKQSFVQSNVLRPGAKHESLLELLRSAETIWNASRVFFGRWKLSPSQFNVLNLLRERGHGLTQSELSRELIMHRSNITGLVDRLETRGLVKRKPETADRRAWRVTLTGSGSKLLSRVLPDYYKLSEELWDGVTVQEATELASRVAALRARAEQMAEGLEA